jgi:hypothetical protein
MNYAPLTWYEQECLSSKAHFEALPRARCSLRLFRLKVWSQICSREFHRPVHQLTKLKLSAYKFTEFVQQQHMQVQRNVPLIRNSADTVLPLLARATRSTIPITKFKFNTSNLITQNASCTQKIIRIYFKYQNFNNNHKLISFFPHITSIRDGSKLQRCMPWGDPQEYQVKKELKM